MQRIIGENWSLYVSQSQTSLLNLSVKFIQAKERQEEIALDMKMLGRILEDSKAQDTEDSNKKVGCFFVLGIVFIPFSDGFNK